jgi:hypothetical protein
LAAEAFDLFVARIVSKLGVLRTFGIPKAFRGWGFDDPREVERLNRRLTFIEEQIGEQAPEVTHFPWPTRMIAKLIARRRAQGRLGVWIVRYRFA